MKRCYLGKELAIQVLSCWYIMVTVSVSLFASSHPVQTDACIADVPPCRRPSAPALARHTCPTSARLCDILRGHKILKNLRDLKQRTMHC